MRVLHPPAAPARARGSPRRSHDRRYRLDTPPTVPRACVRRASRYGTSSGETRAAGRSSTSCSGRYRSDDRHRDRRGHHRRARVRRRRTRAPQSALVSRVPAALPAAGLGRARRRRHLARHARNARRGRRAGRARGRDRDHKPARDRDRVGPCDGSATPPRNRVAGPTHRLALRRPARRGSRAVGPPEDGLGARPVLLGHEAGVAAARRWRRGRCQPAVRHRRHMDPLEPHWRCEWRRARDRPVEREPHDVVRHQHARLVRRTVHALRRTACVPAERAPVERPLRHDDAGVRSRSRGACEWHRRRPASCAVRPSLRRARDDEEHVRHRVVRADEHRGGTHPTRSRGCSPRSHGR